MAQLLTISSKTCRKDISAIGDIVGVFDDTHEFSQSEKDGFNIIKVSGTKAEAEFDIKRKFPDIGGILEKDYENKISKEKFAYKVDNPLAKNIFSSVICKKTFIEAEK